jgi:two-component sensor histidine kinase/ligand-binding sensor domain-containing protein
VFKPVHFFKKLASLKRKGYKLLAMLVAMLWYAVSMAQQNNQQYIVSQQLLSVEDGLAAREAFCGLQDGQGFIWLGTRNGLNRYDGKKFQLYTKRSHKLQENTVVQLASDKQHQLFILYGYSGYARLAIGKVDILNQQTNQIQTLTQTFPNLPFKESSIYWIANDGTDKVNFMTYNPYQLWQYSATQGFKKLFDMKGWATDKYQYSVPTGPYNLFAKNFACIGFGGHEVQYVLQDGKATELKNLYTGKYRIAALNGKQEIVFLQSDLEDNNPTLVGINANGTNLHYITNTLINEAKNERNTIQAQPVEGDSTSVFKIGKKGMYLYSNNQFIELVAAANIKDFDNLAIYQCFADKLGHVWICTSKGVYYINIKKNKFVHYFTKQQQQIETNNQARNIWVNKEGVVYANIWHSLFRQEGNKAIAVTSEYVKYALFEHDKKLYNTSYDLNLLNPQQTALTKMPNANTGRDILCGTSLNDSIMLLGKMESIYKYNTRTQALKLVANKAAGINLPYRFLKRKDGSFWVVGENGLSLLDKAADSIKNFNKTNSSIKLPADNLTDVFESNDGTVWFTTNGDGLYKWNRTNNQFTHFGVEEGLPSNILYRIEEDNQHNLWMSTENGLVLFNPVTASVNTFFEKNGLSHNEFNRMSSYKAADGRLFFGGLNGINAFYASDIINDTTATNTPLQIISFQQFSAQADKLIDLTPQILQQQKVVLQPGDKFFTLEFRLLDFENKINRYAYKIDGQDKDWNYTTETSIRISGLPYGSYTLHIKGQTTTGQWSSQQLQIPILVQAPFYTKWWFILLAFLTIGASIYAAFRYRTQKLKSDKKQLEQVVEKRTAQLQTTLGEREILLKEIHHRVKNNLQIISGLLDLQKEEIEAEESKAVFNEGQSRVKSIALIHQNLYQNENLANIQFKSFVQDLTVQVAEVFEQLNSKMDIHIHMQEQLLDIETAVPLGLIVNELLTNSFKYAATKNKKGSIHITLTNQQAGHYTLIFTDDGPGIQQAVDFNTAHTLGLRLIRGLAAQLYGEATYHYSNGSVFTITLKDSTARKFE